MWEYRGRLHRVVDGDTLDLDLDLGISVTVRVRVRLLGVDCPERFTPAGRAATACAVEWFEAHCHADGVVVRTVKDRTEKYGRYLADVWCPGDLSSLAVELVLGGHVKPSPEWERGNGAAP